MSDRDSAAPVFAALADPTRRALLDRLATGPSATATELARPLPVSRQSIVKHLQVLGEAGLVEGIREGREVRYRLTPERLADAAGWLDAIGARWDRRLERLRKHVKGGRT